LTAIDPDHAASHSRRVVDGIIRKKWNFQGIIITDDLVMGAIYEHGICSATSEALNAGVDLLLVAFDGAQFYRIFQCAHDACPKRRPEHREQVAGRGFARRNRTAAHFLERPPL
jgi:beta-N-acetylhexosaminidase